MAEQMIDMHFKNFVKKNESPSYEDWIAALHPDSACDGLLGMGETVIDPVYYEANNEYLRFWNSHLDSFPGLSPVPGSSSNSSGNESDGSAGNGYRRGGVDLISGDGDDDSQGSPTQAPRRAVNISGGDLMKFD